jgi:hypothetical protein
MQRNAGVDHVGIRQRAIGGQPHHVLGWSERYCGAVIAAKHVAKAAAEARDLGFCTEFGDRIVAGFIACGNDKLVGHAAAFDALDLAQQHRLPAEILQHLARQS